MRNLVALLHLEKEVARLMHVILNPAYAWKGYNVRRGGEVCNFIQTI